MYGKLPHYYGVNLTTVTAVFAGHQPVGPQDYPELRVPVPAEAAGPLREAGGRRGDAAAAHDQGLPHEAGAGLHLQRGHVPLRGSYAVRHPGI